MAGEQKEKTPEELKAERLKRYQDDPDSFVELSDIICMVIRNPKSQLGISCMVGEAKRAELGLAQAELFHLISKVRMSMDVASEMKRQATKNIIIPGSGIGKG